MTVTGAMRPVLMAVLLISCVHPAGAAADDAIYHLALGDPARKNRELPVTLDALVDSATGARLTPRELGARLQSTRLLLLGEEHTSVEFHRVQLQVLRALHESGRRVLVGLEMYPYTQQPSLDRWNSGELTDTAFVEQSRWYEHWGYPWNYYRDIFLFCRDARIPMYAVNAMSALSATTAVGWIVGSRRFAGCSAAPINANARSTPGNGCWTGGSARLPLAPLRSACSTTSRRRTANGHGSGGPVNTRNVVMTPRRVATQRSSETSDAPTERSGPTVPDHRTVPATSPRPPRSSG